jgi:hypothetical protein
MDEIQFNSLTLQEKAEYVQQKGSFIEAEDYYSYQVLRFTLDTRQVELLYDYTHSVISVEFVDENDKEKYPSQLESFLGDNPPANP